MIELCHVSKIYKTKHGETAALKDISFKAQAGEIVGIIGPSGAGKSTLIRLANLLERPSFGQVRFNGQTISALSEKELKPVRRKIGMIFQSFNLLSTRTVLDNVALPLRLAGEAKQAARSQAREILQLTGLNGKEKAYPAQLSGGQRQRAAIARALINRPEVLLCDEATSALDPAAAEAIIELLKGLNASLGLTIIAVAHDMRVIEHLCQRCLIIENGAIVEENDVFTLFTNPQTAVAKQLAKRVVDSGFEQALEQMALVQEGQEGDSLIVKLAFLNDLARQAVISELSRAVPVDISILSGNISSIGGKLFGALLVEIKGSLALIGQAVQYLQNKGIKTEEAGYANKSC